MRPPSSTERNAERPTIDMSAEMSEQSAVLPHNDAISPADDAIHQRHQGKQHHVSYNNNIDDRRRDVMAATSEHVIPVCTRMKPVHCVHMRAAGDW